MSVQWMKRLMSCMLVSSGSRGCDVMVIGVEVVVIGRACREVVFNISMIIHYYHDHRHHRSYQSSCSCDRS